MILFINHTILSSNIIIIKYNIICKFKIIELVYIYLDFWNEILEANIQTIEKGDKSGLQTYCYEIPEKDLVEDGKRWISNNSQNHFTSEYCNGSKGQIWNLPRFDKTDQAFAYAAKWNKEHGEVIFNATPDSHLEVFPKVDFRSLFSHAR